MRILLVTYTKNLVKRLANLSSNLEYCGIVVDEVEPAKKALEKIGLSRDLLYPMSNLSNCLERIHYEYILCADMGWENKLLQSVRACGVSKNKTVGINFFRNEFLTERALRYFNEHCTEFDMFATGISYAETGLNVNCFKRKLFNFARSSQDLYYNFLTAKFAISCGGEHSKIRYALIGLAPYEFHYDLSQSMNLQFLMLDYLVAFNDLHNFFVPIDTYRKFFREEYLLNKLSLNDFDVNDPFLVKKKYHAYSVSSKIAAENKKNVSKTPNKNVAKEAPVRADGHGGKKDFPETCLNNIKILDDYLTLCEENSIRPIMFLAPMPSTYMQNYSVNQIEELRYIVEQACQEHLSARFIDGWELDFINDSDFYDKGHMNLQGATKFSTYINDFIEALETKSIE